ncbi:MAG: integrase core domain-containing protein [Bacteroidota bacterium]|jgi:transposase InsO family protein
MSQKAKREYLNEIKPRYKNASKSEKKKILNEFCKVCRYNRKYAIYLLNRRELLTNSKKKRTGRRRSDNSSQPTSIKYENNCDTLGIKHMTTSHSNPKGNADTERFYRTFKEEVVWVNMFDTVEDTTRSVQSFLTFYNNDYPHSTLGNIIPVDFIKQLNLNQAA